MLKRYLHYRQDNLLSYRLLVYIVLCSSLLAVLSTAVQLFWDYKKDLSTIQQGIDSIEAGYLDSLSSSLWKLDKDQIVIQLDGIMKLPDIGFTSITEIVADKQESVFFRGDPQVELPIQREFQLFYRNTLVGQLKVGATLDNVYQRLLEKFFIILGSQAIKTFLVSIGILLIVHYMIVTHLNRLARYTLRLDLNNLDEGVELEPSLLRRGGSDSLDQLADTLNLMRNNISKQLEGKKRAKQALEQLNNELEQRVKYRTATLKHTNDRLSGALQELTHTKDRLVETEKMAALGELVSGIADEIEKPVNASLETAAQIGAELSAIDLTAADEAHNPAISRVRQHSGLIHGHLQQMAELIKAFRLIAIDPHTLQRQQVDLHRLLHQVKQSFNTQLQQQQIQLQLLGEHPLDIVSYPDIWKQVFSQLIDNSLRHGFAGTPLSDRESKIEIRIERRADKIHILYSDNGKGIPEAILPRIFEPFVATRSEHGGSGLGAHVVYRLVTHLFQGTIGCSSNRGQGVEFDIQVPLNPEHPASDHDSELW
ncbi:MAG: ATP-binding protein [Motiliproteus sp.]